MLNLKGLFSGGLKGLGDTAKDIIAQVAENKITAAEADILLEKELNRHAEVLEANAIKEIELRMADVADSRHANTAIQESDKASWMAKNVGYIIDLTLIYSFLISLGMIVYKTVPEANKELFYMAFGSLGTFAATSINWHRGSSQSSANKQTFIDKMMKR